MKQILQLDWRLFVAWLNAVAGVVLSVILMGLALEVVALHRLEQQMPYWVAPPVITLIGLTGVWLCKWTGRSYLDMKEQRLKRLRSR